MSRVLGAPRAGGSPCRAVLSVGGVVIFMAVGHVVTDTFSGMFTALLPALQD